MTKLFGTDGIRGIFGEDLTLELAGRFGKVVGSTLTSDQNHKIIIGRDTRISGDALEKALVNGLVSVGADVYLTGIIPTPAIAYLVRELGMAAGIVISASHNPPRYNGLKLIGGDGFKLSDDTEAQIEKLIISEKENFKTGNGTVNTVSDATEKYISQCLLSTNVDLKGFKVAIDCGHGASSQTTPDAFRRLGAEVVTINDDYDGENINVKCGSTNLNVISDFVKKTGANIGIAHDGDADRVLAVDENGNEIDGDMIMAICARDLKDSGRLVNDQVVATVMSNLGFVKSLEEAKIRLIKTKVGDRYVLEEMRNTGVILGGEQSGHIIFLNYNTTGDGLVTAIQLASALKRSGKTLSELTQVMKKYPQVLINVSVKDKDELDKNQTIEKTIRNEERMLLDRGRILVRPSGTENIVRVMAEAETEELATKVVDSIVKTVIQELG